MLVRIVRGAIRFLAASVVLTSLIATGLALAGLTVYLISLHVR